MNKGSGAVVLLVVAVPVGANASMAAPSRSRVAVSMDLLRRFVMVYTYNTEECNSFLASTTSPS